ncbi:hypothetical protein [Methanonatronarchaeum sp. AMET-Sl]|uniref:hypothetical protein n=1 Tax=Methanonatronarchaeum sp. AMET-Sl TaxID=3037654 RepID=UPI00244E54BE|nr:hypothetical protein [Methanonatronarchaeum sp. AMET-Sl]WGI18010.1 hypothetical protein QEN48_03130 [Methanonatronarchaeum sp. AMET-Sl]
MSFAGVPCEEEIIELIILLAENGTLEELPQAAQDALESKLEEIPAAIEDALDKGEAPKNG